MVLGSSVVEEVLHNRVFDENEVIGKQTPVAPPPQRLGTHHGDHAIVAPGAKPLELGDRVPELFRGHVVGIGTELEVPQPSIDRRGVRTTAATERGPMVVGDAAMREPVGHGVS